MKDPKKIFRTVIYTCGMLVSIAYFFLQRTEIELFLCFPMALFGCVAAANYLEQKPEKNIWMAWLIYNACATLMFFCLIQTSSQFLDFWICWIPISVVLFIPIFVAKQQIKWDEED